MSKIYKHYLNLKKENPDILYLFKNGKFHIFIAEDADKINEYVVLKKTNLTNDIQKCGFPDCSYKEYMRVFNNHNLVIKEVDVKDIQDDDLPKKYEHLISNYYKIKNIVTSININEISPIGAINFLDKIKKVIDDE